jgi:DNA helicase-2/ATP-dependent DNA helicase PcrA
VSKILQSLNAAQKEAVTTTQGPLLILAGAGSGKTKALTHRIAYLIEEKKIKPWNILAVTFTNKAATEMRNRLRNLLSGEEQKNVLTKENIMSVFSEVETPAAAIEKRFVGLPVVGTFHSVCVRILRKDIERLGRKKDFVIYDTIDSQSIMRQLIKDAGIDEKQFHYKAVLSTISKAKNELADPQRYADHFVHNMFTQTVSHLYKEYQKRLFASNALDFDDLLFETARLFQNFPDALDYYQNQWHYVHIDEYQDTNQTQYKLIKMLVEKYRNLCVIGDSDQSIYSFRGADIRNILSFEKDNPDAKVIKLEQNYRSTKTIIEGAEEVISKNEKRKDKTMWTDNEQGEKIQIYNVSDERDEAQNIVQEVKDIVSKGNKYADFVVLYRTNAQSRMLEESFVRNAIPYKVIGGVRFYARKEIKDILAYLSLIKNPYDIVSINRIINVPARAIGKKTVDKLHQFAQQKEIPLWDALGRVMEIPGLSDRAKNSLSGFYRMIEALQSEARTISVDELIEKVLRKSGYYDSIMDGTEEGKVRYENILELITVAKKYSGLDPWDSLSYFLEEVALVADADSIEEEENAVLLMTVHTAKGLEFPYVFIAGCEESIFPHSRSALDESQLEEERRLMYVAMTRAQKKLYLLYAQRRMIFGDVQINQPSRFLEDIPKELVRTNFQNPYAQSKPVRSSYSSQDDDFYFDQESSDEQSEYQEKTDLYQTGSRVSHQTYGIGTIVERKGDIITVRFDSIRAGSKKFAINIAPLTLC